MADNNFVVLDEICHWLKLMYLFLRHVVYRCIQLTAESDSGDNWGPENE
jgi:hypothetical protein